MRIATSTIYDNQTTSIDNLVAQQQQYGAELSSGKRLNAPSDDPTEISQDLSVSTSIGRASRASSARGTYGARISASDCTTFTFAARSPR